MWHSLQFAVVLNKCFIYILVFFGFIATACLLPFSWVVILASALWQPLLQIGGPAFLHDTGCDDWLPEPKGAMTAVIISISSIASVLVKFLSFFVFVILVIFSKVWRGCTAVAVSIVSWVLDFYPVISPQKKLMLKCSPLWKYPSTRFDRIQIFTYHTFICISCTVVPLFITRNYYYSYCSSISDLVASLYSGISNLI